MNGIDVLVLVLSVAGVLATMVLAGAFRDGRESVDDSVLRAVDSLMRDVHRRVANGEDLYS